MLAGYLLSFVFILLLAAGIFLFGYAARRGTALYVTAIEIIIGSLLVTPLVLLTDKSQFFSLFSKPALENWLWLGTSSFAGFIGGNFFSVINLKWAGERSNSLLSPAITALAVIAGALVFGDKMDLVKIFGVVVTLLAVSVFLIATTKSKTDAGQTNVALWSGAATVVCVTISIVGSIKGTIDTQLSILHSVWLRLIIVLPIALIIFVQSQKATVSTSRSLKFYGAITCGVILQTIIAAYLWFYCTYKIGISTFQVLIATLPFFVYAADVYFFKRTKRSALFLATSLAALAGIWLVMR